MNTPTVVKNNETTSRLLIGLMAFLLIVALIEVILLLVDRQIARGITYKEVDLAAWVQAVGSVVAIGASATLVWWQARNDRRRDQRAEREKAKRYLLAAILPVEDMSSIAEEIGISRSRPDGIETIDARERQSKQLKLFLGRLHQVPLYELPSAHAMERVMGALHFGEMALTYVDDPDGCRYETNLGDRHCHVAYGRHWQSTYAYMKDFAVYLRWELDRLDCPDLPYPGA